MLEPRGSILAGTTVSTVVDIGIHPVNANDNLKRVKVSTPAATKAIASRHYLLPCLFRRPWAK